MRTVITTAALLDVLPDTYSVAIVDGVELVPNANATVPAVPDVLA